MSLRIALLRAAQRQRARSLSRCCGLPEITRGRIPSGLCAADRVAASASQKKIEGSMRIGAVLHDDANGVDSAMSRLAHSRVPVCMAAAAVKASAYI